MHTQIQKQRCALIRNSSQQHMELSSSALLGLQIAGTLPDDSFGSLLAGVLASLKHQNGNGKG